MVGKNNQTAEAGATAACDEVVSEKRRERETVAKHASDLLALIGPLAEVAGSFRRELTERGITEDLVCKYADDTCEALQGLKNRVETLQTTRSNVTSSTS